MSAEEQLPLVDRWFGAWAPRLGGRGFSSEGVLYATVFAPGKLSPSIDERTVLYPKPDKYVPPEDEHEWAYYSNPGLDFDNSGTIAVYHLTHKVRQRMSESAFEPFDVRLMHVTGARPGGSSTPGSGIPPLVGGIAFLGAAAAVTYAAGLWRV